MRRRLAHAMRLLADRIDHAGAPKFTGLTFGYVQGVGLVVEWNGPGRKLWTLHDDDHDDAWHPQVGGVPVQPSRR